VTTPHKSSESRLSPNGRKRRIVRRGVKLLDAVADAARCHPAPGWVEEQVILAAQRLAEALASKPGDPA
jgi:hypothetical protein